MRLIGLILIAVAILLPFYWLSDLVTRYPADALLSQYLGMTAVIAMALGQVLAARLPGMEVLFGGLDRIYVLHKWLGIVAIACIALHDMIDAEIDGLGRETALMDIAEDLGEIAYNGLLVLIIITLTTFIPYHLWRWTHRFIGIFFAFGLFHYAFVQKPFSNSDPLGLYVLGLGVIGLLCTLYMLMLYVRVPGGRSYRVRQINRFVDVAEIVMAPQGRPFRHRAGQFAFFQFDNVGSAEVHPFTLSSQSAKNGEIRVCVKRAGDYTEQLLARIAEGAQVRVFGPFGRFLKPRGDKRQIWLAAGIGITPFMAWARSLKDGEAVSIHLYYACRGSATAPFIDELKAIADRQPGFSLTLCDSMNGERLTAERIIADYGQDLKSMFAAYCGPKALRDQLRDQLSSHGLVARRFHYEVFEIRSGIGLRKLADWVLKRLA